MKKIAVILSIFLGLGVVFGQSEFKNPTAADYPKLEKTGQNIEDFVPKNFTLVEKACGDLNADKVADCALVIKGTDPRFLNKNEGLGTPVFDTNPRILVILFRDQTKNQYELVEQNNSFIIPADSPTMEEPFQAVSIKNGVLQLDFQIFMNAGGWGMTNAGYKFKYRQGEFALIGADINESQRNTGETEDTSYNFLTGKAKISKGNFSSDKNSKVRWKTYKSAKLQTFKTFKAPFTWEIEPNNFI